MVRPYKKKKPGLGVNYAFEQLRPVEHLLHVLYITPDALWSVYCLLKLQALETNHEISPGGGGDISF